MIKLKKNTSYNLIFPSENPSSEEVSAVRQILAASGFPNHDQEWLVQFFARSDCFGDPDGASIFREEFNDSFEDVLPGVVDELGTLVQTEKDRQSRLALLFSFLLRFGPIYSETVVPKDKLVQSNGEWHIPAWVNEFRNQAVFCAGSLDWQKLNEIRASHSFLFHDVVPFLFPAGLPLYQVIDFNSLNPIVRNGWGSNDFANPNQLEYWLIWRFNENEENAKRCETVRLDTLLPIFQKYPETELGDKILGLYNAVMYALNIARGPGSALNEGWQLVARELLPFLQLLNEKHPESHQERSTLTKAWWHLSTAIYGWSMGRLESELPEALRKRLVDSAAKHMGLLRKMLRELPEQFDGEETPDVPITDFYKKAFYALICFASPWKRLKALLLAFTEMKKQAVTSDLRPWHDGEREPPPFPYSYIPMWIEISIYPQNLQHELKRDSRLQDLREQFAKFLLARLKTKGKKETSIEDKQFTNADFVEPRAVWRQCYVEALAALRVNPGGRSHRTLFWLSQNDPDETVRGLAKRAHKRIRHLDRKKPNLDEGASPRRPLFQAFWWLRQAHLLSLGIDIDKPGAQRTLRKDLNRTQEKDDFPRRRRSS